MEIQCKQKVNMIYDSFNTVTVPSVIKLLLALAEKLKRRKATLTLIRTLTCTSVTNTHISDKHLHWQRVQSHLLPAYPSASERLVSWGRVSGRLYCHSCRETMPGTGTGTEIIISYIPTTDFILHHITPTCMYVNYMYPKQICVEWQRWVLRLHCAHYY